MSGAVQTALPDLAYLMLITALDSLCASPYHRENKTKAQKEYLTCQGHSGGKQQTQDARIQRLNLFPLSTLGLWLTVAWPTSMAAGK